jgi:hypothetical protein
MRWVGFGTKTRPSASRRARRYGRERHEWRQQDRQRPRTLPAQPDAGHEPSQKHQRHQHEVIFGAVTQRGDGARVPRHRSGNARRDGRQCQLADQEVVTVARLDVEHELDDAARLELPRRQRIGSVRSRLRRHGFVVDRHRHGSAGDGRVVAEAVEVDGEADAVEHGDELVGLRRRCEARQRVHGGDGCRGLEIVAFVGGRGRHRRNGGNATYADCCEPMARRGEQITPRGRGRIAWPGPKHPRARNSTGTGKWP